ncbi:MAG: fructose-1,6-bisphosphatase [Candidatus Izemoplasmatales bacterium]|jgi:fructose-1,6-bisphosphatase-3|nr:fructose-1,6-bisphosphatase [Candidatus Izemoplasmatales bacterium]MDD4354314.1 fructose-1,6-bisphosphatase [Candidatus Izemoplasmatales bacterium]MDD4987391.1 fructose-1,6-bisphosphatase [Candidatus Izemoplasmatales bacterium]
MFYEKKYLELLSREFPTVQLASSELINLSAILNLPKGTEIFITDIHGEYDAFNHYLKNASGIIQEKIDLIFPELTETDKNRLAFFIYYPTDMLNKYQKSLSPEAYPKLIRQILFRMIGLSRHIATKYTKSKVQKTLPKEFAYIITELLYESNSHEDKERYYEAIIDAIFSTKREKKFIIQISRFIRNLAIDRLHIVGDIFDRGPKPHLVMEKLLKKNNVDIQWGNHDINFLGAACGSQVMIANLIRMAARYNTLDCYEDGYGINFLPLARLANKLYRDDPCTIFLPRGEDIGELTEEDLSFVAKIHKAISIIQFKLESAVISRHPEFGLADRLFLDKIDSHNWTIQIGGDAYPLKDHNFPTIDFAKDPYRLIEEEREVIDHLTQLFLHNEMMQAHAKYLMQNGSMYLKYNGNLLFHAAVPMTAEGEFSAQKIDGLLYRGKDLFDICDKKVRQAYINRYDKDNSDRDYFLFLWQSPNSPLFAKDGMKTFERYFLAEKKLQKEQNNPYFRLRLEEKHLKRIYQEFGLDFEKSKIVNGHVPLDITKGDEVVLAGKKIYSIDGGMSKQYSLTTSIGGYSLISDSHAYFLVSHERFESYIALIQEEKDIISVTRSEELNTRRTYLYETDKGAEIKERIDDLYKLLDAYRNGMIKEKA